MGLVANTKERAVPVTAEQVTVEHTGQTLAVLTAPDAERRRLSRWR